MGRSAKHAVGEDDHADPRLLSLVADDIPVTKRRLLASGVREFAARGFEATTTRQICLGASLSPAALYVHFPSKEHLLFEISVIGHEGALDAVQAASALADEPAERLRRAAYAFVLFHAEHHTLARVIQYELRMLAPDHFAQVAVLRRQIDRVMRENIARGVRDGSFGCPDVSGAALAIESLGIDVSRWFEDGRGRNPHDIADTYAQFALLIARVQDSGPAAGAASAPGRRRLSRR